MRNGKCLLAGLVVLVVLGCSDFSPTQLDAVRSDAVASLRGGSTGVGTVGVDVFPAAQPAGGEMTDPDGPTNGTWSGSCTVQTHQGTLRFRGSAEGPPGDPPHLRVIETGDNPTWHSIGLMEKQSGSYVRHGWITASQIAAGSEIRCEIIDAPETAVVLAQSDPFTP